MATEPPSPTDGVEARIHLIRHAHAGKRSTWEGDDEQRPLSGRGRVQAEAIAADLLDAGIDLLITSRYVRCRETLAPLAARLGLEVVDVEALAEGGSGPEALDVVLAAAADGRVVAACSHGDVLPAVVVAAHRRGAEVEGGSALAKGARFACTVDDGQLARIVRFDAPDVAADVVG